MTDRDEEKKERERDRERERQKQREKGREREVREHKKELRRYCYVKKKFPKESKVINFQKETTHPFKRMSTKSFCNMHLLFKDTNDI